MLFRSLNAPKGIVEQWLQVGKIGYGSTTFNLPLRPGDILAQAKYCVRCQRWGHLEVMC